MSLCVVKGSVLMTLYDALMLALTNGRGVRRPTMPERVAIVPVLRDPDDAASVGAFSIAPRSSAAGALSMEIEDLTADDWEALEQLQEKNNHKDAAV